MNISVKEFRQMIEEHAAEQRQWQDDFSLMADEKEEEIRRLEKKLDATHDAFAEFKKCCLGLTKKILDGASVNGTIEQMEECYDNLLDGVEGY
jgi:hypothetical protein